MLHSDQTRRNWWPWICQGHICKARSFRAKRRRRRDYDFVWPRIICHGTCRRFGTLPDGPRSTRPVWENRVGWQDRSRLKSNKTAFHSWISTFMQTSSEKCVHDKWGSSKFITAENHISLKRYGHVVQTLTRSSSLSSINENNRAKIFILVWKKIPSCTYRSQVGKLKMVVENFQDVSSGGSENGNRKSHASLEHADLVRLDFHFAKLRGYQ